MIKEFFSAFRSVIGLKSGFSNTSKSFLFFMSRNIECSSMRESTKKNHRSTLTLLKEFSIKIQFKDINYDFICAFELFLKKKGYQINTVAKHLKHFKKYVNLAVNADFILKSPFNNYHIHTVEGKHTHLNPREVEILENLQGLSASLRKTRDAFLFCCYTGLRYSDFTNLSELNVHDYGDQKWLCFKAMKTDTVVRVPLDLMFDGRAVKLLDHYKKDLKKFFRLKNNSNVNKELARLEKISGINTHISFHTARHTNATVLLYKGVNITTVQKLLGHKSLKTTQGYANVMDITVIRDLKKILDIK